MTRFLQDNNIIVYGWVAGIGAFKVVEGVIIGDGHAAPVRSAGAGRRYRGVSGLGSRRDGHASIVNVTRRLVPRSASTPSRPGAVK
jgi:hypothetical protein